MDEIRGLLAQGRSSGEIIALGHAPGTVYRLQRELRRRADGAGGAAPRPGDGQEATADRPLTGGTFIRWSEHHLTPHLAHLAVHAIQAEMAAYAVLARLGSPEDRQAALRALDRLDRHREEHLQGLKASICAPEADEPA